MDNKARTYRIRIRSRLDERWAAWFEGMEICPAGDDETILTGLLPDQAALFGVLLKLHDLGLPLVSVECLED